MSCENGQHVFRHDPSQWWDDLLCSRCGARVSETSIVCTCKATTGRDKVKLAHKVYADEDRTSYPPGVDADYRVVEMIGLACKKCGYNWGGFSSWGGDWKSQGLALGDICDSKAEVEYYEHQTRRLQSRLIPQLFVEVAPQKGYFIDWYDPIGHRAIEIDGNQHERQIEHDMRRDVSLRRLGYAVTRIKTKDLGQSYASAVKVSVSEIVLERIAQAIGLRKKNGEDAADLEDTYRKLEDML